jgi:hypothetical protein
VHGHVVAPPVQHPCVTALPTVADLLAAAAAVPGGAGGGVAADTSLERFVGALPKHRGSSKAHKRIPLQPLRNSMWWLARVQAALSRGGDTATAGAPPWVRTLSRVTWRALREASAAAGKAEARLDGAWDGAAAPAEPADREGVAMVQALLPQMRHADGALISSGAAADLVSSSPLRARDPEVALDGWTLTDVAHVLVGGPARASATPLPVAAASLCWLLEAWDVVRYRLQRAAWEASSADTAAAGGAGAGSKRDRPDGDADGAGSKRRRDDDAVGRGGAARGGTGAASSPLLPHGDALPRFAIDLPIVEGAEGDFRMFVAPPGTVHPTAAMVRRESQSVCVEGGGA